MQSHEYPQNSLLADKLSTLTGQPVTREHLLIQQGLKASGTVTIVGGIKCEVKYRQPKEKTGTVTVTLKTRDGADRAMTREFDTEMQRQDVGDIASYFHVSPFEAFQSAVHLILENKA